VERTDGGGGGRRAEMGEDGFSEAKHACPTARPPVACAMESPRVGRAARALGTVEPTRPRTRPSRELHLQSAGRHSFCSTATQASGVVVAARAACLHFRRTRKEGCRSSG
jgi:hypothetical protein